MRKPLPREMKAYCTHCRCERPVSARRFQEKRKTKHRANVVAIFCNSCRSRIQYGLPTMEQAAIIGE